MGQAAKEFRSGLHDDDEPKAAPGDATVVESKATDTPA